MGRLEKEGLPALRKRAATGKTETKTALLRASVTRGPEKKTSSARRSREEAQGRGAAPRGEMSEISVADPHAQGTPAGVARRRRPGRGHRRRVPSAPRPRLEVPGVALGHEGEAAVVRAHARREHRGCGG